MSEYDIILGMIWLTTHGANIDCKDFKITLKDQDSQEVCFCGKRLWKDYSIISEVKEEQTNIEDIPMVCEFPYVFPKELPSLPS